MRWKIGILTLAVCLLASTAWAWTETYSWSPVAGATSYTVEKSVNNGTTWTVAETGLTTTSYTYVGTETGLVIFRVSACNSNGCGVRAGDGLWHNEAWVPPLVPGNLQVQ